MSTSFSSLKLRWLIEETADPLELLATEGDQLGRALHIDPAMGQGHFDLIQLPYGSSFFKGVQRFLPAASGHLVPVGEFEIDYGQPSFMVQTVRGSRICHREFIPEQRLIYEEGRDLFCHMEKRHVIPMGDGSHDSEMVSLCLHLSSLEALLGEADAAALLEALGIQRLPSYVIRSMPKALAGLLHGAMARPLQGSVRKLYLQAKALEYLSALSEHLQPVKHQDSRSSSLRLQVHALHGHLLDLAGKVPALEALARQFGIPARRLNEVFTLEYGESIYSFIAGYRLDQARNALTESDIPMKVLADRLGYSHVNHFINAFRRRFGEPPGRFRKSVKGQKVP